MEAPKFKYTAAPRAQWPEGIFVSAEDVITARVKPQIDELARARLAHVRHEGFGIERIGRPWLKILEKVSAEAWSFLSDAQKASVLRAGYSETMTRLVDLPAAEFAAHLRSRHEPSHVDTMPGPEYERYCAEQLANCGWRVQVTKASGDQGADIIASKSGTTTVIQCKRYTTPVGNGAVQEAVSARFHYATQRACVVSNSVFTSSARELAASTGVVLLHHSDLPELYRILGAA